MHLAFRVSGNAEGHQIKMRKPQTFTGVDSDRRQPLRPQDNEAYRSFQHRDARTRAGKREFASHEGMRKGSRRSFSVSGVQQKRDRLPHDLVSRLRAGLATVATLATNGRPSLPSPAQPHQRSYDIDDVVTQGGRVFPVPGNTEADRKVDTPGARTFRDRARRLDLPLPADDRRALGNATR